MMRRAQADRLTLAAVILSLLCICTALLGAAGTSVPEKAQSLTQAHMQAEKLADAAVNVSAEMMAARTIPVSYLTQPAAESDAPQVKTLLFATTAAQEQETVDESTTPETAQPGKTQLPTPSQETVSSADGSPVVAVPNGEDEVPNNLELIDTFYATAYCVTGMTSTGTYTTINRTLAVNPNVIPYGTHVWMFLDDGTLVGDFIAEDTGSNMMANPYVVDIYMGEGTYNDCILWGAQHVTLYAQPETDESADAPQLAPNEPQVQTEK